MGGIRCLRFRDESPDSDTDASGPGLSADLVQPDDACVVAGVPEGFEFLVPG
jgi:hypothetical protein